MNSLIFNIFIIKEKQLKLYFKINTQNKKFKKKKKESEKKP